MRLMMDAFASKENCQINNKQYIFLHFTCYVNQVVLYCQTCDKTCDKTHTSVERISSTTLKVVDKKNVWISKKLLVS